MKILIDTQKLQQDGVIDSAQAELLERHAIQATGSTAINMLIAFGVMVLASGFMAMFPKAEMAAFFGLGFCVLGVLVKKASLRWRKLGSTWCLLGALVFSAAAGAVIGQPLYAMLFATVVLGVMAVLAESSFLAALAPLALLGAIGGSTGYWHACYSIAVREPFITLVLFTPLAWLAWQGAKCKEWRYSHLSLIVARMSVIVVNFAFWVGSLWGSLTGKLFGQVWFYVDEMLFVLGWAAALLAAGVWGARNGRRFMVNTVVVFASIHFYTQWFEHLGGSPVTVMLAGLLTVGIGLGLWRYNQRVLEGGAA